MVYDYRNKDIWYNALPLLVKVPMVRDYAGRAGGIEDFYEKRNTIWHCPEAQFPAAVEKSTRAFFSMAMNSKLIQPENAIASVNTIKFNSILKPSATVAFLDGLVDYSEPRVTDGDYDVGNFPLGQPSAYASRFAPRHSRGGILGFCDGHVEWKKGDKVVETRPGAQYGGAIFPGGEIIWCADPVMDPN
jgi:prepilin-type processing-associated H-X9-DG protein